MVNLAHFEYPDVQMFRMGAMAPLYPFLMSNSEQVGITRDHRAFYDILRRLRAMFQLDLDLSELRSLGDDESKELLSSLERISSSNPEAKQVIEQVRRDYSYTPYQESVELDPALDRTLEDILLNMPDQPEEGSTDQE